MKMRKLAEMAAVLGLTMAVAGTFPAAAGESDDDKTVTVTASGIVMEVPDMAEVTFSVESGAEEAEEAQTKNTEDVEKVMEALTGLGVDEKSVQTSDYYMDPQYDYDQDPAKLVGYRVRTTLTVSDLKIGDTGKILGAVVDAGVNDIGGVTYTCSTYDEKYQEALKEAVKAAKAKADTLTSAAGASTGKVVAITEGWQDTSARYQASYDSGAVMESAKASSDTADYQSVDMNPGSMQIQANVTVTYEIKD